MYEFEYKLRELIINELELEDVNHLGLDDPLFETDEADNYALDSVDAVELAVLVKRNYNIELSEEDSGAFASIRLLAAKVMEKQTINVNS
ncbi:acyl carrier protein [Paenibacillus anaericanus]|nr:phosphopantetheine-binding protein [Paenibacillus anaericanus]MDQ0089657.1 acyl carrier protein [Paenibacillus anaericanus]